MNSKKVALPTVVRRTLGGLNIEATAFGDGRVGIVAEGPAEALRHLATGLRLAGWLVETYPTDTTTIYAEGRGDEPKAVVEIEPMKPGLELDFEEEKAAEEEEPEPPTLRRPPTTGERCNGLYLPREPRKVEVTVVESGGAA